MLTQASVRPTQHEGRLWAWVCLGESPIAFPGPSGKAPLLGRAQIWTHGRGGGLTSAGSHTFQVSGHPDPVERLSGAGHLWLCKAQEAVQPGCRG